MLNTEKLSIDLTYLGPSNIIIYPIYSQTGEKIVEARTVLTTEKINEIIEKYGRTVYYTFTDEMNTIPNHRINTALNHSREIMDEIEKTERLSKSTYKESEKLIETILNDLYTAETHTIKLLKNFQTFDDYTYNHSVNVLLLAAVFSTKLKMFSEKDTKSLALGAYLHDIGKMKIDKQLLNKKGKLDTYEYQKMKRHPQLGYEIIKQITTDDKIVQQSILFHHEKYNNEGYYGLPYENLPPSPKIISICDIFDALTTKRPYRDAIAPANALLMILNLFKDNFDYKLISDFINEMGPVLNGSKYFYARRQICELNTRELALIVEYSPDDILRPKVIVFCKFNRIKNKINVKFYDRPLKIDLTKNKTRVMTNILQNSPHTEAIKDKLLERSLLRIS